MEQFILSVKVTLFLIVWSVIGFIYFAANHFEYRKYTGWKLFLLGIVCGPVMWVLLPLDMIIHTVVPFFNRNIHEPFRRWLMR